MAKAVLTTENLISCLATGTFENLRLHRDMKPIIKCLQANEHKFTATRLEFIDCAMNALDPQFPDFMAALGQKIKDSGVTIETVTVSHDRFHLTRKFGSAIGHCRAKVLVIKNCDNATEFLLGYYAPMGDLGRQSVTLVNSNVSEDFVRAYSERGLNITEKFDDVEPAHPILEEADHHEGAAADHHQGAAADHHQGAAAVATEEVLGAPGGPAFVFDDAAEVLGASSKAACASVNSFES